MSTPTAMSIGNFDGAHRGHAALIRTARHEVGPEGRVVLLSFDPHPLTVLRPNKAPPRLTGFEQRVRILRAMGVDEVVRLEPAPGLLARTPEEFIESIVSEYGPSVIVEGPDFRFGRDRAGGTSTLQDLEGRHCYRTIVVDAVEAELADQSVVRISSSVIRWLLCRGRVRDAAALLGRPYELESTVFAGDRRGRELGVPTCNLQENGCLLPADGIYAGEATHPDGRRFPAAISVGTKPTFGSHPRVCEAHLLDYDGPLDDYGWTLRLRFQDWLRDQLRYDSVDDLIDQLQRDLARAREVAAMTEVVHERV